MRPSWDETRLLMAEIMASRSRCERGAGVVIASAGNQMISEGYTGPPATWGPATISGDDCRAYCQRASLPPARRSPSYADCPSAHAEMNALAKADYSRMIGGAFYISSVPCMPCAKTIANSGVTRVIWRICPVLEAGRDVEAPKRYLEACGLEWAALI